jgi:hypothetical protein
MSWIPRTPGPYVARSASDNTDDWPYWYVAGPDGRLNAMTRPRDDPKFGAVLTDRKTAQELARKWNE